MKHCKLQNVFRGGKNKKEKVKLETQNEKIVETDMDIWYYTHKKNYTYKKNSHQSQEESVQCKHRGSHQRCSVGKGVLRNFAKFTGKLPESLFNNVLTL